MQSVNFLHDHSLCNQVEIKRIVTAYGMPKSFGGCMLCTDDPEMLIGYNVNWLYGRDIVNWLQYLFLACQD
jgi:hypothetical protein